MKSNVVIVISFMRGMESCIRPSSGGGCNAFDSATSAVFTCSSSSESQALEGAQSFRKQLEEDVLTMQHVTVVGYIVNGQRQGYDSDPSHFGILDIDAVQSAAWVY